MKPDNQVGLALLLFFMLGIAGALLSLLPGIIAHRKKHHQEAAIWVLNIALGWSAIGWVLALVWAHTKPALVTAAAPAPPEALGYDQKKCPECGSAVLKAARVCRYCNAEFWSGPKKTTEAEGP